MHLFLRFSQPSAPLSGGSLVSILPVLIAFVMVYSSARAQSVVYSSPIVITKGGTYTGNWESRDTNVPAVLVKTKEPVIIENSNIRSAGNLIHNLAGANLTVRNCRGYGLLPTVKGFPHGRFVRSRLPKNLVIVNNYFENTAGIYVYEFTGDGSKGQTIKIMRNKARNINGKHRDGVTFTRVQLVQFNQVVRTGNVEIAWNEVINEPGKSAVEDNINMFNSNGVSGSPIRIHNNFIKGGYPVDPKSRPYSGGGIITDGSGTGMYACAYIHAYENVVVSTTNYGMGIAAGNNIQYYNNRVISSALFPDGTRIPAQYSGIWLRNYYNKTSTDWYNNVNRNNVIGWVKFGTTLPGQLPNRHDISRNACKNCPGNVHLPNPVTLKSEEKEHQDWLLRCANAKVTVGVTTAELKNVKPEVSITSPAAGDVFTEGTTINLAASATDADGTISKVVFYQGTTMLDQEWDSPYTHAWTKVPAGSYTLTAKAIDNDGSSTTSAPVTIKVVTNRTPVVSAGEDKTLTLPATAVVLTGSASDPDGTITAYQWTKQSGPAATMSGQKTPTLALSGLKTGTYEFRLAVTDNKGATASDKVTVTVAPALLQEEMVVSITSPVAGASFKEGAAIIVQAEVRGNATAIKKVEFFSDDVKLKEEVTAPYKFTWEAQVGDHTIKAVATDKAGGTAMTETEITVVANLLPEVSAGGDESLLLPANTISLTGSASDPDGTITAYQWTKQSGPAAAMSGQKTPTLSLSGLTAGTYVFRFTATDDNGATAFEEMTLDVEGQPNQEPAVSLSLLAAGPAFTAGSAIVMDAEAVDPDGAITKVEFFRGETKLGEATTVPYTFTWNNASAGEYALTAMATDNEGASAVSAMINILVVEVQGGAAATGTVLREVWLDTPGMAVADIPLRKAPDEVSLVSSFEGTINENDDYASRLSGYVHPPATGSYTFWISGDNDAELWLSTTESPDQKVKIAFLSQATLVREWNKSLSQKSAPVFLQAGKKYYIEALHKESMGGDHVSVGWQLADGTLERPIPGNRLSPYSSASSRTTLTALPDKNKDVAGLKLYPNPAKDVLVLELPEQTRGAATITISDGVGRAVYQKQEVLEPGNPKFTLNLAPLHLPKGVYYIQVKTENLHKALRFAKE
jgi:hypothetical protein